MGKLALRERTAMPDIVKVGSKGEIVLPRRMRAELGLQEGHELLVTLDDEAIVLRRKARRFGEYLETLGRVPFGRTRA